MAAATLAERSPGRYALSGELDFDSAPALWPQGERLFRTAGSTIEIDLAGVERADSAGLALLVTWQACAQSAGCSLRYTSVPERLLAIARISDADSLVAG
jgi:phospholipid transport system transporter-binding protein